MAEIRLTEQQRAAVENRGGSLLVSAAAGSGKTKVLVERVFSYLTEEHCHVDDFLIITYTRAAAAELRASWPPSWRPVWRRTPATAICGQQMFRVYQADIKTVDGFCAQLLRQHVHLLPPVDGRCLTPDFRVLDESEAALLRERALEAALEEFYRAIESGDEEYAQLADTLGAGRDDRALARLIPELHGKLQSHPYPEKWLAQCGGGLDGHPGPFGGQRIRTDGDGGHGAPRRFLGVPAGAGGVRHGGLPAGAGGLRRPLYRGGRPVCGATVRRLKAAGRPWRRCSRRFAVWAS